MRHVVCKLSIFVYRCIHFQEISDSLMLRVQGLTLRYSFMWVEFECSPRVVVGFSLGTLVCPHSPKTCFSEWCVSVSRDALPRLGHHHPQPAELFICSGDTFVHCNFAVITEIKALPG